MPYKAHIRLLGETLWIPKIASQPLLEGKMPNLLQFLLRRILTIVVTLFIVTVVLYGIVCAYPPETRAML